MDEINKLIDLSNEEIDYLEKSWSAYRDDPTIIYDKYYGAGYDNVTKYAKEMDDLELYNGIKQGYAWCKVFVDWCFIKVFGVDRAGELLYGWTAGVTQAYNWFRSNGQISNTPKIGDLVIFGDCDHIGLVINVDMDKIYTIEGNTTLTGNCANGGQVAKKEYYKTNSWIKCYARPRYNIEPQPVPIGDPQIVEIQKWISNYGIDINIDGFYGYQTKLGIIKVYQIELNRQFGYNLDIDGIFGMETYLATPIVGYGAEGNITKSIQSMLYCRGYNTNGVDGLYYDGTKRAVETFQSNQNLIVDGIFGQETAEKLFN